MIVKMLMEALGARTRRTPLPQAMAAVLPRSLTLDYRDEIVAAARESFPGEVGVSLDGFAGRMLPKEAAPAADTTPAIFADL